MGIPQKRTQMLPTGQLWLWNKFYMKKRLSKQDRKLQLLTVLKMQFQQISLTQTSYLLYHLLHFILLGHLHYHKLVISYLIINQQNYSFRLNGLYILICWMLKCQSKPASASLNSQHIKETQSFQPYSPTRQPALVSTRASASLKMSSSTVLKMRLLKFSEVIQFSSS